jgi:PAS domain S-box-containing protein
MKKVQIEAKSDCSLLSDVPELGTAVLYTICGVLLCLLSCVQASAQPVTKNVLILYGFAERSLNGSLDSLESLVRARVPSQVNFYVEYLESRRFGEKAYEELLVENLRDAYSRQNLDLVIVEPYPALQFALKHRDELFPGVPIVFFGIDSRRVAGQTWPGVTGVTETVDVRATIDLALHLHPKTSTIAIITNNSDFEKYWLAAVHDELFRDHHDIREVDLVTLPTSELLERVSALPNSTVVLFQRAPLDSSQPAMGDYDILEWVGRRLPTYCIFPMLCLSHGGIGGVETGTYEDISLVTELAGRVLSGERPENIPVIHDSSVQARVDWRQLRHWHIPESALPPGSVILYREPTVWEHYRKYMIAALLVIAAQALLIIGLLWQRARKRKAEAGLRESEKRFRVMADTTPSLVWMCDAQGKITYLNERRIPFTGPDPSAGYGDTWTDYVHPDDLKNVLDTVAQALKTRQPFSTEYRLRRSDGVYRWMFDVASPRVNGDGSFAGFIGSAIDTTEQKLAQQALEKVSGQLIEAQEKERSRIARDLHDDICQRLALLSMELEQANRSSNGSPTATKKSLEDIQKHCSEIAGDVQSMSHQLHSSKLDYLGIVSAIRGFCNEFSKQHEVNVEFLERNVPTHLPKDVPLCLFRVAQEALQNAAKYSGVSRFTVELSGMEGVVQLMVSDAGAGFDVEEAKKNRGLGLVSMQERVYLLHGTFSIESEPGKGTKIFAAVPLAAEKEGFAEEGDINEATTVTRTT